MWNPTTNVYQGIIQARMASAILWSNILQMIPLLMYTTILSLRLMHPLSSVRDILSLVLSIRTWLLLLPLFVLMSLLGILTVRRFQSSTPLYVSRFQTMCSMFSQNNPIIALIYSTIGGALGWLYLGLNNRFLIKDSDTLPGRKYLVEENLFLIINCVWCGMFYFLCFDVFGDKNLNFPVVQQHKFLQVKSRFFCLIKQSVTNSFWPTCYFIPLYYWKGASFCCFIQDTFYLQDNNAENISVVGLLSLPLFCHGWLLAALLLFNIFMLKLLLEVFLTYHYAFPVISINEVSLPFALKCENVLISHLAYYDLFKISSFKSPSRTEIFSLSQPGGHPHVWNSILQECLKTMNNLVKEVNEIYRPPPVEKLPSPKPKHIHTHQLISHGIIPSVLNPQSKMRNLMLSEGSAKQIYYPSVNQENILTQKISQFLNNFYNRPGINYFFGDLPDVKIHYLVSSAQPVIWATQSIASLAAIALVEDQYGIVLKDVSHIIHSLLQLKSVIDKIHKYGNINLQKRFQRNKPYDVCMKNSLRSAVKRSLYKIAIAYSVYLNELPLSSEDYQNVQNFVKFRE